MTRTFIAHFIVVVGLALGACRPPPPLQPTQPTAPAEAAPMPKPLSSWNDGPVKQSILDFVAAASRRGDPRFVPPEARIAVFDNDGTLWAEQPVYFPVSPD